MMLSLDTFVQFQHCFMSVDIPPELGGNAFHPRPVQDWHKACRSHLVVSEHFDRHERREK
jgi:hypothetical protein